MKTFYKIVILIIVACLCCMFIYYNVDKAKSVQKTDDILVVQNEIENTFLSDTKYSFDNPKVILNPYNISPLTALVIFETSDLTSAVVTIKGKDKNTTFTNTFNPSNTHILPIYGLYPDKDNIVTIEVNDKIKTLHIKTAKLPDDFILPTKVENHTNDNDLYFVTPSSKGYTAGYDTNGDVRFYLTNNMLWDIQRLKNGHLLLSSDRLINPPYYTTGLYEMDLLGKIYYEYTLPGGYHHDVFEMENGNFLVATNNFASGTVEDYVVEIDRKTGEIIKEFDISKILPKDQGKSENWIDYDWFHNNAVWYDSKTNSITLSGRHQDAVINIDYNTGNLNYIIGDSTNWNEDMKKYFLKPIGNLEWQYSQHASMVLPNGNIFLFDNGNNRSKTNYVKPIDNYSRGVIYEVNPRKKTIKQVWEYGKKLGSSFYSPYISDVDYLGENHYLIHSGGIVLKDNIPQNYPASLTSYDELKSITKEILNDKVVFEMQLPTNTYRVEKLSLYSNSLYTKDLGVRLGNMGETKTNKNTSVFIHHKIDKTYKSKNITINKEPDRLVVSGTFQKTDKVQIILDNVFTKKTYDVRVSKKPYTSMCIDVFNEKEKTDGIKVTKYINDVNLKGKFYIYIKINGKVYDTDLYVNY